MKRNQFIFRMGVGVMSVPFLATRFSRNPETPLDKDLVRTFVGSAHRDQDKVLALLKENPTLLNAAHDWGHGDFETALGAATHVGYKELVTSLIAAGAQTNIFTACLFGRLDIVRLMLETFPQTLHAKGPHGFTLLHHAVQGEDEALEVKQYLESLGAVETKIPLY
jgi:ankyrin repeat protein